MLRVSYIKLKDSKIKVVWLEDMKKKGTLIVNNYFKMAWVSGKGLFVFLLSSLLLLWKS